MKTIKVAPVLFLVMTSSYARPPTWEKDSSNQDVTPHPEDAAQHQQHERDPPQPLHLESGRQNFTGYIGENLTLIFPHRPVNVAFLKFNGEKTYVFFYRNGHHETESDQSPSFRGRVERSSCKMENGSFSVTLMYLTGNHTGPYEWNNDGIIGSFFLNITERGGGNHNQQQYSISIIAAIVIIFLFFLIIIICICIFLFRKRIKSRNSKYFPCCKANAEHGPVSYSECTQDVKLGNSCDHAK